MGCGFWLQQLNLQPFLVKQKPPVTRRKTLRRSRITSSPTWTNPAFVKETGVHEQQDIFTSTPEIRVQKTKGIVSKNQRLLWTLQTPKNRLNLPRRENQERKVKKRTKNKKRLKLLPVALYSNQTPVSWHPLRQADKKKCRLKIKPQTNVLLLDQLPLWPDHR